MKWSDRERVTRCGACDTPLSAIQRKRRNYYCSRSCALTQQPRHTEAANAANQIRYRRKVINEVLTACRDVVDEQGRIPVLDVAKLVMQTRRLAYLKGYNARWQREKRQRGQAA